MNILAFRGLIRDQRHWWSFSESLQAANPRARFFAIDFPGVGTEAGRESPWSIRDIRLDVQRRFEAKIRAGEWPRDDWHLMAISLGAMVAMDWCAGESPFRSLTLVNSSASDVGMPWERFHFGFLPRIARAFLDYRPEVYEPTILSLTTTRKELAAERAPVLIAWQKKTPATRAAFAAQMFAATKFRLPHRLTPPTQVLVSRGDRLVRPSCSERIAQRLDLPLRSHDWGGHDLSFDDPDWIAREVSRFAAASPAPARS